ncbi:hypothetical protein DFH07DRAFT_772399 [Mycena maculata]|uniref:Uncharacterized protein n=1 Tax=Mycena maculata TaxID=230809 RepID=A0AAD7NFI2_9AGAR|nr:hypothetical protein DFH07DRAFT_772399 [Mycena maculata]
MGMAAAGGAWDGYSWRYLGGQKSQSKMFWLSAGESWNMASNGREKMMRQNARQCCVSARRCHTVIPFHSHIFMERKGREQNNGSAPRTTDNDQPSISNIEDKFRGYFSEEFVLVKSPWKHRYVVKSNWHQTANQAPDQDHDSLPTLLTPDASILELGASTGPKKFEPTELRSVGRLSLIR